MARKRDCEACGGEGVLAPCRPACEIVGLARPWIVVEKCDVCDRFPDDLSAALSRYRVAGWFRCTDGGEHALANVKTQTVC
jgi:hypothetical protein